MFAKIFSKFKFSPSLSKFCQARVNVMLFRCLPFRVSRVYLLLIGKIYFFFKRREKNLICQTIRYVLGRSHPGKSLNTVVRRTFRGIIDHYHEKLFVAYSNFRRLLRFLDERIELEGEEEL